MSIASAIQTKQQQVANAYTACNGKGATMPATQDLTNLATCIGSISSGSTPTLITKNITQNGTYNASSDNADGYSSVTVNVSGGGGVGIPREVSAQGVYQAPSSNFTFSLPSTATDVAERAMYNIFWKCTGLISVNLSSLINVSGLNAMSDAFKGCTNLTNVDLSNLTTVNNESAMSTAFGDCTNLTNVDLSNLTTVDGKYALLNCFQNCTSLTSIDLSSLTTVKGQAAMSTVFKGCTNLTNVDLSNLTIIGTNSSTGDYSQFSSCFNNCTALTSITFPKLEKIYCTTSASSTSTFASNNKVQKMYFPKLNTITYGTGSKSQTGCKNIFYGCSALTELHFGSANQSAIQATAGYSTAWGRGAGNVTIYFDL